MSVMGFLVSAGPVGSTCRPLRTLIVNDLKGNSSASSLRFSTFASSLYYLTPASSLHSLATPAASRHRFTPRTPSSTPFCALAPTRRRMATWGVKANKTSRLGEDRFGKKVADAHFPNRLTGGEKPGKLEKLKSLFGLERRSDDAVPMVASAAPPRFFVPVLVYRGINEETMRTLNSWKAMTISFAFVYPLGFVIRYFLDKPFNAGWITLGGTLIIASHLALRYFTERYVFDLTLDSEPEPNVFQATVYTPGGVMKTETIQFTESDIVIPPTPIRYTTILANGKPLYFAPKGWKSLSARARVMLKEEGTVEFDDDEDTRPQLGKVSGKLSRVSVAFMATLLVLASLTLG